LVAVYKPDSPLDKPGCPTCKGQGWTRDVHSKPQLCPACDGRGMDLHKWLLDQQRQLDSLWAIVGLGLSVFSIASVAIVIYLLIR
jgi:hypothetical protein